MFVTHFAQSNRFPRKNFNFGCQFHCLRIYQNHFFRGQSNNFIIIQINSLICMLNNCRNIRCCIKFTFTYSYKQRSISFCSNNGIRAVIMHYTKCISPLKFFCGKSYCFRQIFSLGIFSCNKMGCDFRISLGSEMTAFCC